MYNQNKILLSLYNFRFATQKQLQAILGHSNNVQTSRELAILRKHEMVGCIKPVSINFPGTYYLTPKGIKYISEHPGTFGIDTVPRHLYSKKEYSEKFIDHQKMVLAIYLKLKEKYSDDIAFKSKIQLSNDYPINPPPDAELTIRKKRFILLYIDDWMWKTLIRKKLYLLYDFWQFEQDIYFLIVIESEALKRKVDRYIDDISHNFAKDCYLQLANELSAIESELDSSN